MTIIEAQQPLRAAKLALIEFRRDTIVDILEMELPPEDVEVVAESFLILRGIRDVSWKNARSAMLDDDYFECLSDINCDLISLKQLSQCKSHLKVSFSLHFAAIQIVRRKSNQFRLLGYGDGGSGDDGWQPCHRYRPSFQFFRDRNAI